MLTGLPNGNYFCMRGGVMLCDRLIKTFTHNHIIMHYHSADRHFTARGGLFGEL